MPSPFFLRPPEHGDYAHVVRRHGELYAQEYGWDDRFRQLVESIVTDFQADAPGPKRMWIADCGGEVAGSIMAVRDPDTPDTARLRCLYVESGHRGHGIGLALIEACVAFCREAGYEHLVLWTMQTLTAAARLYERANFVRVDETPTRAFGHDLVAENWRLAL
ncbi:MAG: GNAT family N-acetyltransferase [Planctomycetota bacterium]|nr:GNAT family N-acetyltransferase [Planctomycetota bacterium]